MLRSTPAPALNYVTEGVVTAVYDGDTITVLRDLGHDVHYETNFRLIGIDTPEKRGKEKPWGEISREYLIGLIGKTTKWRTLDTPWGTLKLPVLIMRSVEPDKYGGRWLGEIWLPGGEQQINVVMIEDGYARPYDGDKKTPYPLESLPVQPEKK